MPDDFAKTTVLNHMLKLHHRPGSMATRLVITAHGAPYDDETFTIPSSIRELKFFVPHGYTSQVTLHQAVKGKLQPLSNQTLKGGQESQDYWLTKFEDTYQNIRSEIRTAQSGTRFTAFEQQGILNARRNKPAPEWEGDYLNRDVVSIRNRKVLGKGINLSDLLKAVVSRAPQYSVIECDFCRGSQPYIYNQ